MDFVVIEPHQLQEDTLLAVITSFILREGTDYGSHEIELATKEKQVKKQIEKNEVKIVYDPTSESLTLMTLADFKRLKV